ncbi:MAG TPA: NUDIX domain-containing protein [Acidobacteriota bacterium]|nr:NUDIX domain-containing protein [Acidobacteriota bacterium]
MAKKISAGLLVFRRRGEIEVFLVHPGGPFWSKKDAGAWSVPKGEIGVGEDPLQAAKREFQEETGFKIDGEFYPLDAVKQSGGKVVQAWAVEADCDPAQLRSNRFSMEWPPKSGKTQDFPEVDRAAWFNVEEARKRINAGQIGLLDQLISRLATRNEPERPR